MKFGKEYEAQMVPEWQTAYLDYNKLKSLLKQILHFKRKCNTAYANGTTTSSGNGNNHHTVKRKMTMYRAFSGLSRRCSSVRIPAHKGEEQAILVTSEEEGDKYETMFLMSSDEGAEYEMVFFQRLDDEFNKANGFYKKMVAEVVDEANALSKQMNALIAFRLRVDYPHGYHEFHAAVAEHSSSSSSNSAASTHRFSSHDHRKTGKAAHMDVIQEFEMSTEQSSEEKSGTGVIDVAKPEIQTSDPQIKSSVKSSYQPPPVEVLKHVKINVELETPRSTIKGLLTDAKTRDITYSKEELKKADDQLRRAFHAFYQKLLLLKSYSFLNLLAISKIMKKYDKITLRSASKSYLNMVDCSYLGSSDEVTRLLERVETTFIKYFANGNRRKGMGILRPAARRERHRITFFVGFFAGCSIALMISLILIVRTRNLYHMEGSTIYMQTMFPLYSLFGLIVLHMLMYAANIFFWRRYRVNYPFIFGFKPGTEMGYREVLLMSLCLAVLALAGVHANLDMEMDQKTKDYKELTELVPLGLVVVVFLITVCPFDIVYRSSRFLLLRSATHCIFAPLYKVTLPDFFLADQLTSQVQAFRSLEFYVCYYGWGDFKRREAHCNGYPVYRAFYYIVAVIPYWSRFWQCVRRTVEEKDAMQGYNGLKCFITIVAVVMRTLIETRKKVQWKVLAGFCSIIATIFSIYWDIVIDWGLLQRNSKNRLLRDKLIISHKSVYYVAMVLNILLRFAWLQSVLGFEVPFMHVKALSITLACLEIIRRGIWNFFRLENEHLNNVGKYRAFKSVPLPFNYDSDDDHSD